MAENKGWIKLYRQIIESKIFKKPPLYLKVWIYLLSRAQHKDFKDLKRGELWTSVPEIREACSWYVGYRKVTPTYKEVYSVIQWLREPHERICERTTNGNTNENMIVTTKAIQGMLVKIENYNVYQEPKNYEGNTEGNCERSAKELRTESEGNNINKNDKNVKNIYSHFENDKTEEKYLEIFNHWNKEHEEKGIAKAIKLNTDIKKGVDNALKLKKEDDTKITIEDIKESISNYAEVYNLELFTYQWRLVEFLKRKQKDTGIPQLLLFLNNGTTYVNCKAGFNKTNKQQANKSNVNSSQNNNNGWNGYKKFK